MTGISAGEGRWRTSSITVRVVTRVLAQRLALQWSAQVGRPLTIGQATHAALLLAEDVRWSRMREYVARAVRDTTPPPAGSPQVEGGE